MRRVNPYIPRRIDMGERNPHPDESPLWEPPRVAPHPEVITFHVRRRILAGVGVTLAVAGVIAGIFLLLVPCLGLLTAFIESVADALADLLMAILGLVGRLILLLLSLAFVWGMIVACIKDRS